MKVAITGSNGLIGSALVSALESVGDTPIRIVRDRSEGIHWDIEKGEIDVASLEGVDAVVHLAGEGIGEKRWSESQKRQILESRTKGTELLSGALTGLTRQPSVFLSGSAIGYYGDRGDEPLSEQSSAGDGFLADVTVAWEASTKEAECAGIKVTHLRTGIVLSREGGVLKKLLPLYRSALGGRLGSGDQWMSWIGIDDEVGAIQWLLRNPLEGAVNLTAPEPVRNSEFNEALGRSVGRPAKIPVPKFGPRLLLGRELADGLLFSSAQVHPSRLLASGYEFSQPTLAEALAAETKDR